MAFWFEFDSVNKILLVRFEGRLTEEVMAELYEAIRKYSTATDASAGILDFSSVTEFAISTQFVCDLANQEPAMGNATTRPRIIVVPEHGFRLWRLFQVIGGPTRPLLQVARTLDEALAALGVQSPHFEPLV